MVRKLFIVDPANERLYRALHSALANESDDVEIFYDRRDGSRAAAWRGEDRRVPSDVAERIRRDGFAVVRPAPASRARAQHPLGVVSWALHVDWPGTMLACPSQVRSCRCSRCSASPSTAPAEHMRRSTTGGACWPWKRDAQPPGVTSFNDFIGPLQQRS
jgi:hypothetical protein